MSVVTDEVCQPRQIVAVMTHALGYRSLPPSFLHSRMFSVQVAASRD